MIKNVESLSDLSYISVVSNPDREIECEDENLTRYCHFMEGAVLILEVLVVVSMGLCAYLI